MEDDSSRASTGDKDSGQSSAYDSRMFKFSAGTNLPYDEFSRHRKIRQPRDPMSHRLIEKRRRDRMNNCLADLSRLIPPTYLKQQGQGRIEKTEIIEMAIKYIHNLRERAQHGPQGRPEVQLNTADLSEDKYPTKKCCQRHFYYGFKESMDEVATFLVECQGSSPEDMLYQGIIKHMERASQKYYPGNYSSIPQEPPAMWKPQDSMESRNEDDMQMSSSGIGMTDHSSTQENSPTEVSDLRSSNGAEIKDDGLKSLLSNLPNSEEKNTESTTTVTEMKNDDICAGMDESVEGEYLENGEMPSPIEEPTDQQCSLDSNGDKVYKFKNIIKLRFTEDMKSGHRYSKTGTSSSSNSSKEENDSEMFQLMGNQLNSYCGSSSSTNYPNSRDSSTNGYSSNGNGYSSQGSSGSVGPSPHKQHSHSHNSHVSKKQANKDYMERDMNVPGFAMHPSATHYIPIMVHLSYLSPFLQHSEVESVHQIFHPISIPVRLGGPVIPPPLVSLEGKRASHN
ncbi:class E basic helix-loop-helix protein 40-like [Lingula anatina]|uniref:Class E basic helix-loop-helix protein 40-like n=1 Tax=Lingula anatina TaxID=7574 RepID=A0A1S3KBM8_LINAN|nr:class E basic helix-loop-helix protein 40-like [Lingula anatina]|eukprot:XP_013419897.1 class E basic helix-loop-helix protein 40-like [Lingula anatina]